MNKRKNICLKNGENKVCIDRNLISKKSKFFEELLESINEETIEINDNFDDVNNIVEFIKDKNKHDQEIEELQNRIEELKNKPITINPENAKRIFDLAYKWDMRDVIDGTFVHLQHNPDLKIADKLINLGYVNEGEKIIYSYLDRIFNTKNKMTSDEIKAIVNSLSKETKEIFDYGFLSRTL